MRQAARGWIYRLWVILIVLSAGGYLLYRFGLHAEAGLVQSAAAHMGSLVRGVALAVVALAASIAVGAVASERDTLGDSVMSRGISRHQYYLAKWHARTVVVVATFAVLAGAVLTAFHYLLSEDVTLSGGVVAVAVVASLLAAVVAWGVAVGALTNNTMVGVTLFWIVLYGLGFVMTLLPDVPSPERLAARLPHVLRGNYDLANAGGWVLGGAAASVLAGVVGMVGFSRKDV